MVSRLRGPPALDWMPLDIVFRCHASGRCRHDTIGCKAMNASCLCCRNPPSRRTGSQQSWLRGQHRRTGIAFPLRSGSLNPRLRPGLAILDRLASEPLRDGLGGVGKTSHWTVFCPTFPPSSRLNVASDACLQAGPRTNGRASLRSCGSDRARDRGACVTGLAHDASFHAQRTAPWDQTPSGAAVSRPAGCGRSAGRGGCPRSRPHRTARGTSAPATASPARPDPDGHSPCRSACQKPPNTRPRSGDQP